MSKSATTRHSTDSIPATLSLTTAAATQAANGSGRSQGPHPRTLLDIFNATAVRCGGSLAIDAPDAVLTYRELSEAASALGHELANRGVGPGDRVGVCLASGTAELYIAILAVLWAGAAYVPIDADDPPARGRELLAAAGACAVVRDGLAVEELAGARGEDREPTVDDDAWIIFTSGSTGDPKGVAVTHRAAAAFVDAEAELWSLDISDRVLAGLSVAFDASCEEIWLAWRHGAALVPAPRSLVRAGADLGPWIAERGVSVVSTVPTLAAMWEDDTLAGVRLLILGGEVCPEGLAERLSAEREVWNTYGPTEATVVSTAARLAPGKPVTIGWPLRGWETAIVDDDGRPVAIGEAGELAITGVGLARYIDPGLDAERFAELSSLAWDRAYRTGDIVRETIDGLQFVGRRDDQVKIGGRRVELGELDARLAGAPGVRAALTAVRESAAGNKLLVAYLVGEIDLDAVRAWAAERLPEGLVPQLAVLDELPRGRSGKVDRKALPWPPPSPADTAEQPELADLTPTAAWLAERWVEQLGPVPLAPDSDFFALGGSSLAAAKLVSALRTRFPAVAVADVYNHRRLEELAARLEEIEAGEEVGTAELGASRWWSLSHLAGMLAVMAFAAPAWVLGALAIDRLFPGEVGPQVGWPWLIAGWLVFASRPGRALVVAAARRALLGRVEPGRYPRHSSLAWRIWLIERLADSYHVDGVAGTPWAARYARLLGHRVGREARLGTIPSAAGFVSIGEGATLEADVDAHGWWIDGQELVIGEVHIGPHARVGTRTLLMPGSSIGERAEIEPGSAVDGEVPAGERWAGSPARHVGRAGDGWPTNPPTVSRLKGAWRAMYSLGLLVESVLPLLAAAPGLLLLLVLSPAHASASDLVLLALAMAPLLAVSFVVVYALLVAAAFRAVSSLVKPGWHAADGAVSWALWFGESLMSGARGVLFPLYSSLFIKPWLRLAGIRVGRRTEVSTVVGLNRLGSFGERSFAADDVAFATAESREGWLRVAPIEVGNGTFLGNGAVISPGSSIGDRSLVGVLTTPPARPAAETSWFGAPALELPRVPDRGDPARTTDPPLRLVFARAAMELVRVLLPGSLSAALGILVFWALGTLGGRVGLWSMMLASPFVLLAGGLVAALLTITIKWLLIGRYRPGEHPLWSFFVWRDEIINSCQEQLAGAWLLDAGLGTPAMSVYLRLMGAKVGRDVWCETLTVTEFELAELGDGSAINRHAVVETHLFHDRLMRIGPATIGPGATLGPSSAMLPDTKIGAGCAVGGRSVVMRGEELPARTRWQGAPVSAR